MPSRLNGGERGRCCARDAWVAMLRRCGGGVVGSLLMFVGLSGMPLGAQVAYNVLPAGSPGASDVQPTPHGTPLVTLRVRDSSIAYVVRALVQQAHMRLVSEGKDPLFTKRVTVQIVAMPLMEALASLLHETGLTAALASDGQTVMIRRSMNVAEARVRMSDGIVSGRVIDSASGKGVSGATVAIAGTKLSTLTSESGEFVLREVPVGAQVVTVKLFGYRPVSRRVVVRDSTPTVLRIVLTSVPSVLTGVVTTATGVQRRLEVGNDITVINVDSVMQVAPITNVTQLLTDRVPGLVVQNTSGIPGAPSRLRLRGTSSLTQSDDPIVIVDGVRIYADQSGSKGTGGATGFGNTSSGGGIEVHGSSAAVEVSAVDRIANGSFAGPSALDQIDPNSIETIEVMKGPSASALYGSDAANGVIVITTKKGKSGPPHWNLTVSEGWTTLPGEWPSNYYRFGHLSATGAQTFCQPYQLLGCELDSLVAFQALNNPLSAPFGTGSDREASVGVSGGRGTLTYSLTGSVGSQRGYLHLPGIIAQQFATLHGFPAPQWMTDPDQYSTWGVTGQLSTQITSQGAMLTFSHHMFQSRQQQGSLQGVIAALSRTYLSPATLGTGGFISNYYERAVIQTATTTDALTLNNWTPWRWLPISATLGLNSRSANGSSVIPRTYAVGNADSVGTYNLSKSGAQVGTFTAGTAIAQRFLTTAFGINVTTSTTNSFTFGMTDIPFGVMIPLDFTCTGSCGRQSDYHTGTYGWYIQPTVNLHSRFFVSPGIRLDGGTASGDRNRFNPFPKLDFSYIAVDRNHPRFGMLTLLRPRLAFGIAGVQPGPTESLRLFSDRNTVTPYTEAGTTGATIPQLQFNGLGNTQLHPERSREVEGGFDAELGESRVSLSVSGYQKMRYDAIVPIQLAPSLGSGMATSIAMNVGTIRNTGIEMSLAARLVETQALAWSANGNMSSNRNQVISVDPRMTAIVGDNSLSGINSRIVAGYPLAGLWERAIVGYADANQDGVIDPTEIRLADSAQYIGEQIPNYQLNFSSTLVLFRGRLAINSAGSYDNGLTQVDAGTDLITRVVNNPASSLSQQAAAAAAVKTFPTSNIGRVQTVNTLRWTSLSIQWIVPDRIAHIFRSSQLAIALQGSNLGLHSNYRGKDPDVNAFSSGNSTGDNGQLPQPRLWSLQLTLR